jgi:uncharacterized membrane protein YoaK (UPF0700 family)
MEEQSAGVMAAFMGTFLLFILAVLVFFIIIQWKIFTKAGEEGWKSIIPIYSTYILLRIVGKPGWWLLLFLIPIVNIVFAIWMTNMLSKSFGKEEGFTVGLLLLGVIFYPILAFGGAAYQGPYGDKAAYDQFQRKDIILDAEVS